MSGLQPVGPLAELAVARALLRGLEARVADADVIATRRKREGFLYGHDQGFALGRRGRMRLVVIGFTAGAVSALGVFAAVLGLA